MTRGRGRIEGDIGVVGLEFMDKFASFVRKASQTADIATTQTHPNLVRCRYGRLSYPDVGLVSIFHACSQVVIAGVLVRGVHQDKLELERDLVVVGGFWCIGTCVTRVHLLQ